MAHTRAWEETKPVGTDSLKQGDNDIREKWVDLRERLEIGHVFNVDTTHDGKHLEGSAKITAGLSTDTKPTADATYEGGMFYETDTGDLYVDSGGAWVRIHTEVPDVQVYAAVGAEVSLAASTQNLLNHFDTEDWDYDSMWVIGTPSRIIFTRAGVYDFGCRIRLHSTSATANQHTKNWLRVCKNTDGTYAEGSVVAAQHDYVETSGADVDLEFTVVGHGKFAAADYIEVFQYHEASAEARDLQLVAGISPYFWASLRTFHS